METENETTTFGPEAPFGYCPLFGTALGWYNSQDIGEDYDERQVDEYHCAHCGCSIDVYHPSEEEKKDYPFWNQH